MTHHLHDTFTSGLDPAWNPNEIGGGVVSTEGGQLRLYNPPKTDRYANAQISDYRYGDFDFAWTPPVHMTVTTHAGQSADHMVGTAGFGFWNHPFSPDTRRLRLPSAIWYFFAAPPNNLRLAHGVSGHGWKAITLDTTRPRALALAPFAPPAALLMNIPPIYDVLYPPIQRALRIAEKALDARLLSERHTYTIDWRTDGASFIIDGEAVLETPYSPKGALGFVTWIDNQYAVVTPQGRFAHGVTPLVHSQNLIIEEIIIHGA